jgi:hypothetical protein
LILEANKEFFNILTGINGLFNEHLLNTLFSEVYKGTMGEIVPNKNYMKSLIKRTQNEMNIYNEETKYSYIIARLESTGWIEAKFDSMESDYIYNFTRNGRKIAQTLFQISNKKNITRQRNVRSTLGLLESYKKDGDPYDLVDAYDASDYIVSDLMDQINEINDYRKQMLNSATKDIQSAGEDFLDYLDTDFRSTVLVHFKEDNITKNAIKINQIISDIQENEKELVIKNERMVQRYPHLKKEIYIVDSYLDIIKDRVSNAKDNKLPELAKAIKILIKYSEMVLKQVSSLMIKRSSLVNSFALSISQAEHEVQEEMLESLSKKINAQCGRYFEPAKIKIKNIKRKTSKSKKVLQTKKLSDDEIKEQKILSAIRESKAYIPDEIKNRLISDLKNEESLGNCFVQIENYKDLSYALNLVSIARTSGLFQIQSTGHRVRNRYFETDEHIIKKKENE